MIDLSRRLAHNAYDKKSNPTGIVDLGSATNDLMLDELLKWMSKNKRGEDKAKCKLPPPPFSLMTTRPKEEEKQTDRHIKRQA